jgi:DNA-binding HxlR family transcriptional regulator
LGLKRTSRGGGAEYRLTPADEDLRDVVMSLGLWSQRRIESSLKNLDPSLLM